MILRWLKKLIIYSKFKECCRKNREILPQGFSGYYPPLKSRNWPSTKKRTIYLIISRIVGGKGLALAVKTAIKLGIKIEDCGQPAGYYMEYRKLAKLAKNNVEFLGQVDDNEWQNYMPGKKPFGTFGR